MASPNNNQGIKITLEDLAGVGAAEAAAAAPALQPSEAGAKSYGSINSAVDDCPIISESKSNLLLQGWFYLGAAGLVGALVGWGICEPWFIDDGGQRWGNLWLLPSLITFMCLGFAISESIAERSVYKAVIRGALALPLGIILGFVFDWTANIIFAIGVRICLETGIRTSHHPVFWITRGLAWMVFGVAGGVVYGIIGQSMKKAKYGVLGGMLGAGLGGLIFDPISFATHGGAASRAVGFALFGMATGIAMGLVESALKDRWLFVTTGPLAGKQFILYKNLTIVGSQQQSDIYLFKDPSILPQHAVFEMSGSRVQVRALGSIYVSGQPASSRVLQDGDLIQIGRYGFRYKEKQRA